MYKAYYIETKSYWKDTNGTDHQIADGGDLPIIYSSLKKALKRAHHMIKLLTEQMGYEIVIPNDRYPGVGSQYHYACRLRKNNPKIRLEIRIYTINVI